MARIISFMIAVAVGLGLYLYPQAVGWHQERAIVNASNQYQEQAVNITLQTQNTILARAQAYNERLYLKAGGYYNPLDAEFDADYQSQLRNDSGRNDVGAIAEVAIPAIGVRLPVFRGTSDAVLQNGAGHVYGTSVPVGGINTHAVISAHSEVRAGQMFSHLTDMKIGDEFFVMSAGQTLRYVVDQIEVVLPTEIESAQIVPGEDYVTLLTCTPTGINSHRLLVRGARAGLVPNEVLVAAVPFPWFGVRFAVGLVGAGILAWLLNKRQQSRQPALSEPAVVSADLPHPPQLGEFVSRDA